ncbi:MAG: hypothetical protein GX781_07810 [Clostridiales bacterium]|nr:hypothetical protein [Clostridiales bacterium]
MMNKKHMLMMISILIVSVLLVGCSSANNKVPQKTEGADATIEIKDNSIVIENSDISIKSSDKLQWPADKMAPLPRPDAAVKTVMEYPDEKTMVVNIEFNKPESARDYIQQVKNSGYIENSMDDKEDMLEFIGYNQDNSEVMINYLVMSNAGYITLKRDSNAVKEYFANK